MVNMISLDNEGLIYTVIDVCSIVRKDLVAAEGFGWLFVWGF